MASCKHCGAPLAANTNRCNYCGTRNDVDLHARIPFAREQSASERICPHCDIPLATITLKMDMALSIERCEQCFGLFFDRGEIEYILQASVTNIHHINFELIDNINKDRYHKPTKIKYVKCPECSTLMNRVNFGHRSAVIVDQCISHGIWLDNGELIHLLEWKKAGGEILNQQTLESNKKKEKSRTNVLPGSVYSKTTNSWDNLDGNIGWDTAAAVLWLIWKIFFHR